ncbi:MAG: transglutaminase domain-containing protein [Alloprevotella sp.]|nr:transglutaminase domain-containing protein [Alloprevotella sp.]
MRYVLLTLTLALSALPSMLRAQTQAEVSADFARRYAEVRCPEAHHVLDIAGTAEERSALEFLYAYMDWADIFDQTPEYFLENVRYALRTRTDFPWGASVPDREWRHFVLPVRVNNENLDDFRPQCYDELRRRVAGCTMREAVLEVNHWCHEYVTYRPSDARTSSPLASMRTATGRCGEESTFTVAALRAVGIPARQVYTPRWAHTDDNHAWVEAYVDGRWHFLGACEPAADLDIAWFNQPASRAMLMNTTVLGRYRGDEQVLRATPTQTTINVTDNYAPTATTRVQVVDEAGRKVPGARVRFGLYNYAEFYPIYQTDADADGRASLVSGCGDLLVWAAHEGRYGFAKVTAGKRAKPWTVRLEHRAGEAFEVELNVVPPPTGTNLPRVSAEAEAVNNRRLAREDSVRLAYVHSWPTESKVDEIAEVLGYDEARIRPLFRKSEGNYMNLFSVLEAFCADTVVQLGPTVKPQQEFLLDFLETLSDKDLRDFDLFTVTDHFRALLAGGQPSPSAAKMSPEAYDRFKQYVLSPRIADEMLSPWRSGLRDYLDPARTADYRRTPALLADFVNEHVTTLSGTYARYICESPVAALRGGYADTFSKGLCFVALCRTLGIPARFDAVTSKFQYFSPAGGDEWVDVSFAPAAPAPSAQAAAQHRLALGYTPRKFMENPGYYYHFTLSRLDGGMPQLQNYGEEDTWAGQFRDGTPVPAGDYLLTSGTRMADGSVLARLSVFPLRSDTTVILRMREDPAQVQVIGSFNSENVYHDMQAAKEQSVLATSGRGYFVVGLLRANNEPSMHILHDIELQKDALEAWGRSIVMLFPTQEEYDLFQRRLGEFPNLPRTLRFGVDTQGQVAKDIFGSGLTASDERPAVLIGDTFNRVVFFTQGYTIGIGDQLCKVISKL